MRNFLLLTRVFFLSGFNTKERKKGKKGKAPVSSARTMLYFGALFIVLSIALNFSLSMTFFEAGLHAEYLALMIFTAGILTLVLMLTSMQSVLFRSADYELLDSYPISKWVIVAAKISSVYITDLFENLIIALPAVVIYIIGTNNVTGGLLGLLAIFLASFLPLFLSSIIGLLTAVAQAKSKHGALVSTAVSIGVFVIYFVVIMVVQNASGSDISALMHRFFLTDWIIRAIQGNGLTFLNYALLCIGVAIITITGLAYLYRPINTALMSGGSHEVYKGENGKQSNQMLSLKKVLLNKEWRLLSQKPNYLVNSYLGQVLLLIISAFFIFGWRLFIHEGDGIKPEDMETIRLVFYLIVPGFGIMFNSMTTPTGFSISMEGRENFELLNSYPANPDDIVKAKTNIAHICGIVTNLIDSVIISVCFIINQVTNPFIYLGLFILPILTILFVNEMGMLCGLRWPKLDYENETQVLKNSMGGNMATLFSMLSSIIPMGLFIGFLIAGSTIKGDPTMTFVLSLIGLLAAILYYLIGFIVVHTLLKKRGPSLYNMIMKR